MRSICGGLCCLFPMSSKSWWAILNSCRSRTRYIPRPWLHPVGLQIHISPSTILRHVIRINLHEDYKLVSFSTVEKQATTLAWSAENAQLPRALALHALATSMVNGKTWLLSFLLLCLFVQIVHISKTVDIN